jgi:hypothetical protein
MEDERKTSGPAWAFGDRVAPDRHALLSTAPSFDCIATSIAAEMEIVDFKMCMGTRPEVKGCERAEFKLKVGKATFDLFFNSRLGYRGLYHQSVSAGESANAELISKTYANLIVHVEGHAQLAKIERSLSCASAKVWINEGGVRKGRTDIAVIEELLVDRWVSAARRFQSEPKRYREEIRALDGIRAPTGTILEIKGAFIDRMNGERITEDKKNRSQDIHLYGFT